MNIEIIAIGKTKTKYVVDGLEDYLKRLRRYVPVSLIEIPDIKNTKKLTETQQKDEEGKAFLSRIAPGDHLVLLDERGKQYTSREFADKIQNLMLTGKKKLVFLIGGPYGFSNEVYNRGNEMLSLSKMTFNHEMVRAFFAEQIYRAMTILKGEPYHHD